MTEKELTVLGHLSPQDYLQFMQAVWAQVTVLTPERLRVEQSFKQFSSVLNELEEWLVSELKNSQTQKRSCASIPSFTKERMNQVYGHLIDDIEWKGYKGLLNL